MLVKESARYTVARIIAAAPCRRQETIERIGPYVYRHYAPAPLPPQQQARVAIVGGGPVGLATALGLARQGVASVVIEADDSVCIGSRAICISRRSLEICDRLGALPDDAGDAACPGPAGAASGRTTRCSASRCRTTTASACRR